MKKIEYFLNLILVALAVVLCVYSWIFSSRITSHEYEQIESDVLLPYQFSQEDDGMVIQSEYRLAWKHSTFFDSRVVAYDSIYDNYEYLKQEYEEEYKSTMPQGKYYNWYYQCFWIYLILFLLISLVTLYFVGIRVRDYILYLIISIYPTFRKCAYFLYSKRTCCKDSVELLLPKAVENFIKSEKNNLLRKYDANFVELIIFMLRTIGKQLSTEVKFYYNYNRKIVSHDQYLNNSRNYWISQIGIDPKAENVVESIKGLQTKQYVELSFGGDSQEFQYSVARQLSKLFSEILGSAIFKFVATRGEEGKSGILYVTTSIENSSSYFTWSGASQIGKNFPGLRVRFDVYHYVGDQKTMLWSKYLEPVCKYSCPDSEFRVYDLYTNMVRQTIETFVSSLKKL